MKQQLVYIGLSLLMLTGFTAFGQTVPKNEQQIPLYPGATPDTGLQEQATHDYAEIHEGEPHIRSVSIKVYSAKALPDEVCRFYINKLGATEGFPNMYPAKPWYETSYFSHSVFEDQYHRDLKIHDGKWWKSVLSQRPQWEKGEWLEAAFFEWEVIQNNGDLARFNVSVEDYSIDNENKTSVAKTVITTIVSVEKSEEAIDNEADEEMQEAYEEALAYFNANPPTAADLRISFYPGWEFLAKPSAEMSAGGDYYYYVFSTTDTPEKVLAFYEQKSGKKANGDSEYGYIIPLRGNLPVPDEGLTIQKNTMFGGGAKTVVTIQKQVH